MVVLEYNIASALILFLLYFDLYIDVEKIWVADGGLIYLELISLQ